MNLLREPWLLFRTSQGEQYYGAPTEISNPDVVELALPRADFQGAAYQWLIGLLQTVLAPEGYSNWMATLATPPSKEALASKFEPLLPAFNLDGVGPRFMPFWIVSANRQPPKIGEAECLFRPKCFRKVSIAMLM